MRTCLSTRLDPFASSTRATLVVALTAFVLMAPGTALALCSGEVYDEFGPMIGGWDLEAEGQTVGSVEVRADEAGCSLLRTFRIGSETAQSILFLDPADGQLNELVIDQDGGIYRLAGRKQRGSWNLTGTFTDAAGSGTGARVSIESLAGGGFRETLDLQDGSDWGRVFDFRFGSGTSSSRPTRVTAAPTQPAAPASSAPPATRSTTAPSRPERPSPAAPAPETPALPENSRIRVSSGAEGGGTSVRSQEIAKIVVDSPMLVDLQLGPIDKLPDGYAWSSKDLARYEIDGATIENVEVRRRTRRGKSRLLVTLFGSSPKFTDEFDVSIEVVDAAGNSLSDIGEGRLYVGRSIGQQIEQGSTSLKIELETRTDELNAALASGERPKLAIKVVARD